MDFSMQSHLPQMAVECVDVDNGRTSLGVVTVGKSVTILSDLLRIVLIFHEPGLLSG